VNLDEERRRFIELRAYGPDDPDGSHTAAVLSAYFEAERLRDSCRAFWPRLAGVAVLWVLLAVTPPAVSPRAFFAGLLMVGVAATWVGTAQWRARMKLTDLLQQHDVPGS